MINLVLFGTSGCHLCEQAEELVDLACQQNKISIQNIDIAEQEQWQEKYAVRIPVLYHPETKKELGWPFTQPLVQAFIRELSND